MNLRTRLRSSRGFTLADIMVTAAIGATVIGIAIPVTSRAVDGMRLSSTTRDVERELQTARLRAVSKNRSMVVRFNCPSAGRYRLVEITGVAATDTAADRCDESKYPYPGPKDTNAATPAFDGPVRIMNSSVSVSGSDLAFTPNGTAGTYSAGAITKLTAAQAITLSRGAHTSAVQVNSLGKIHIQ